MKTKFKILLATDYSEAVKNAERYAVQFAKSTCSDLFIIHTYEMPFSSIPLEPDDYAKARIDYNLAELKRLEQHSMQLFDSMGITKNEIGCECIVHEGGPAEKITDEAKKINADFIIAGTHGASGFREFFFGTHAWQIIEKSVVPVLAIPKNGMFTGIKNIAFAAGEREGEIAGLNFIVELAKEFDAEITVLHITNYSISKKQEAEAFKNFRAEVLYKIPYKKLHLRLAYHDDIIEGLNDFCFKKNIDWLVLSPEKHSFWKKIFMPGSGTTKKMSLSTFTPLLSVPDHFDPPNSELWKLFEMDERFKNEEF